VKCKVLYSTVKDQPKTVKREWVGLTDEQMKDALVSVDAETKRLPPGMKAFAQAIETRLKELNT
jgi:DnaJ-domain-containing protein 1